MGTMDAFWHWSLRRFGPRFPWVLFVVLYLTLLANIAVGVFLILWFEGSDRYLISLALAALTAFVPPAISVLPGSAAVWGSIRRWITTADDESVGNALPSTYEFTRGVVRRTVIAWPIVYAATGGVVSLIAGAVPGRVVQWVVMAAALGASQALTGMHFWIEASVRPLRRAIAGDSNAGDHLPRSRPKFGTWLGIAFLALLGTFTMSGALLGSVVGVDESPGWSLAIAFVMVVFFAMPQSVGMILNPSLQPLHDLSEGTRRVAAGDFSQRLAVEQDDDLGALAASFNRMQAGLAERERLHAAFGSYVDPVLAERLLSQGDDLFAGDRVDVTVMFADVRDFTPFAEANTAEDTVAYLNTLFEIMVTSANQHGGHVNKFLGDGAMVVFGAPERNADHADRAIDCAIAIQRGVLERFDGSVRIGVGINTGTVIAGTIGGAGKLEFTLIGDTVNIAARVEQLTKTTGDPILLTDETRTALARPPVGLVSRGAHALKGKSAPTTVYAVDPRGSLQE